MLNQCNFFCSLKYLSRHFFWHSHPFTKPEAEGAVTATITGRPRATFPSSPRGAQENGSACSLLAEACGCAELPERAGPARAGEVSSSPPTHREKATGAASRHSQLRRRAPGSHSSSLAARLAVSRDCGCYQGLTVVLECSDEMHSQR